MTTLSEMVAVAVVHSSAAALSHFGVTLEPAAPVQAAPPPVAERVIARSPQAPAKLVSCPKPRAAAIPMHV
jgi:hypothetical protein